MKTSKVICNCILLIPLLLQELLDLVGIVLYYLTAQGRECPSCINQYSWEHSSMLFLISSASIYTCFFLPITCTVHQYFSQSFTSPKKNFSQSFISGTFNPSSQVSTVLNWTQLDSWVHHNMLFVEYISLWSILYGSVSSQRGWDWWRYPRIKLRKLWTELLFLHLFIRTIRVDELFICISSFSRSRC